MCNYARANVQQERARDLAHTLYTDERTVPILVLLRLNLIGFCSIFRFGLIETAHCAQCVLRPLFVHRGVNVLVGQP